MYTALQAFNAAVEVHGRDLGGWMKRQINEICGARTLSAVSTQQLRAAAGEHLKGSELEDFLEYLSAIEEHIIG